MTIICHRRQFIFLKSKKTAGTSIELWLAPNLDPEVDLISTGIEFKQQYPKVWKLFDNPSTRIGLALRRVLTFTPIFRPHMYAAEVRRFVGDRRWRSYCKISIVRNPWDRTISLWRWRQHTSGVSTALADFVAAMEKGGKYGRAMGAHRWDNWPFYAIEDNIVADEIIRYESIENDARTLFNRFGISGGELPRAKSGMRKSSDSLNLLTPELVERIAVLHKREIEAFGYVAPAHNTNT
jgi:hypothetical protein